MGVITAADAVLTLAVAPVFPDPVQIQGFSVDDIYDIPTIRSVETLMGVDGILSGGFVFSAVPQTITLQADSLSNAFFDRWWAEMQRGLTPLVAQGQIRLPSVGTKFIQTQGFLTGYPPAPAGRRVLQPRRFEITWERIAAAPV